MLEERKSDNCTRPKRGLFLHLIPDFPLFPAKEQQRLSIPDHHVFNLSNTDGMASCRLRRMETAFQVRQRSLQDRSSVCRTVKTSPSLNLGIVVVALRTGIVFRDSSVVFAQHVNAETLLCVLMGAGAPRVVP